MNLSIEQKARAEKQIGELWNEGEISQEEAEAAAKQQGLEFMMIAYWCGIGYEQEQIAGANHG